MQRGIRGRLILAATAGRRSIIRRIGAALLVSSFGWALVPRASAIDEEVRVESAFLYNFLRFVTWPESAFAAAESITIGIMGDDPFGGALDSIDGVSVKGRRVEVKHVGSAAAASCHILYISRSEQSRVGGLLRSLAGRPVLTVSECAGFARQGGIVEFVNHSDTVKFKVNLGAARENNLKLSSQMLGVAIEIIGN